MTDDRNGDSGSLAETNMTIRALAGGGDGIGQWQGQTVFVPHVAPGDVIRPSDPVRSGGRFRAADFELVTPGPGRVDPACPRWRTCGGCQWMQVDDRVQVEQKQALLERAFRGAHLDVGRFLPMTPSPKTLGYRRRARLAWQGRDGTVALGFLGSASHDVVDVTTDPACPVLEPALQRVLAPVRRALEVWISSFAPGGVLLQGQVMLLADWRGRVQVAVEMDRQAGRPKRSKSAKPLDNHGPRNLFRQGPIRAVPGALGELLEDPDVVSVGISTRKGWVWRGADRLDLDDPEQGGLLGRADGFSQANRLLNESIRDQVREAASGAKSVLELYAGSGNLTRILAEPNRLVTAVEKDRAAVQAILDARGSWPGRVHVRRSDAERFLQSEKIERLDVDLVVLDPPRSGSKQVAKSLCRLAHRSGPQRNPHRILSISCDPMTAARDLKVLSECGFGIDLVAGFDSMPQTSHFELLCLASLA
ncbi:MAG: class I SAM-dependent RNA methyltransferase [Deltaproteobacteria bacterium]|nr:class I SAM-dependent RNA methyltransferase [Deltaproteobacteria bacterium]